MNTGFGRRIGQTQAVSSGQAADGCWLSFYQLRVSRSSQGCRIYEGSTVKPPNIGQPIVQYGISVNPLPIASRR